MHAMYDLHDLHVSCISCCFYSNYADLHVFYCIVLYSRYIFSCLIIANVYALCTSSRVMIAFGATSKSQPEGARNV
jgi:hypothetical protein